MPVTINTVPADASGVQGVLADLAATGVVVVPGVLTPDEAADALDRLWAAARESDLLGRR